MTFFDDLGLKAAEQLESSLGPYVALASYKRMLGARRPTRTRAIAGALRCAASLSDATELEQALELARTELEALSDEGDRGARDAFAAESMGVAVALAKGNGRAALALARGVQERAPSPLHAYVVARLEDDAGTRAFEAWFAAVRLASAEPRSAVYRAALCRFLELAADPARAAEPAVRAEAVARAVEVELDDATPAERLVVARARLLAGSKFQRASGLSLLVELVRSSNEAIRERAVLACARHADAASRLEPIEHERLVAAFRAWPNESERDGALARLALRASIDALAAPSTAEVEAALARVADVAFELRPQIRRVQHLLREVGAPDSVKAPFGSAAAGPDGLAEATLRGPALASLAIDAILALRASRSADAIAAFARAETSAASATVVPAITYASVSIALASREVPLRKAAAALAMACFRRRLGAPRQGFTELGLALARAGLMAEAREVLSEAARLREPSAASFAGEVERRLAYLALAKGDRVAALEGLRRASELLNRAAPADPRG